MENLEKFYPKMKRFLRGSCLAALLAAFPLQVAWGQPAQGSGGSRAASKNEKPQTPPVASPQTSQNSPAASSAPAPSAEKPQTSLPPEASTETKISPKQAEELFHSVDEILRFASKDTGLPIHNEVKRRLVDRDEVVAFVQKHMAEDEDAQRLRRSELVLKKFGLLPRDFDLGRFLIALLREQVAGYYDPKTKTVNLLDWIDPEQQRPVLAHELTHALQDQSFDLEKYMKASDKDLATQTKDPTPADIADDEAAAARQSVVEGQAMVVLLDYELSPTGQTVQDSPQIVAALKEGMLVGTADSVQFRTAPLYIKEALTFPYRYGTEFEAALLSKGGKDKAYAGVFRDPPRTTRQIMQPDTYLAGEKIEPMPLPDFKNDFKSYQRFDVGAVGEFDVAILIDQYQGTEVAKRLYPEWRGGYYYAVRPQGDPAAPLGLLYVSRWSNPEKAAEFAWAYAKGLERRYRHVDEVKPESVENKPTDYTVETLTGRHAWLTEEGTVVIDVEGDRVLASESLDQETTERVEREVLPKGHDKQPATVQ